jgi:dihydrofolate reductase
MRRSWALVVSVRVPAASTSAAVLKDQAMVAASHRNADSSRAQATDDAGWFAALGAQPLPLPVQPLLGAPGDGAHPWVGAGSTLSPHPAERSRASHGGSASDAAPAPRTAMSPAAPGSRTVQPATDKDLVMRSVTYSMSVSLDGYIVGPDGDFSWTVPDDDVFRFWIDEIRDVGVHLMGRRLYETMLYWETADQDPSLDDAELEWAALWKPLPKVVFSTTLSEVQGTTRLATGSLADEIERLRAEPGEGDIAIGGATLAAEAAALDLIDEYRTMVYPVLVGGGIPYFPHRERRADLELVEHRTFNSKVVYLHYRLTR